MSTLTISRPPAAAAMLWIKEAWRLFKLAPIPWMGMTALVFMVVIGINMLPWIGRYAIELLSPFLVAGYFSASRAARAGEPVSFIHLAAGVNSGRGALLRIGGLYMAGSILIVALVDAATGGNLHELMQSVQNPAALTPEQANRIVATGLPAMLMASVLFTPLLMATWFAPGLALFEDFSAGRALWWSLWACWVNWRPILYYSTVLGLFGMVAIVIPFGLGMLVFLPLTLISTYVAYLAIFTLSADPAAGDDGLP